MKPDPDAADVNTLPAPIQVKIEPTGYKTPQSQFVKAESIKSPSMTKMKFKIPKKNSIQASQTQCSRMRATSRSSQNPSPLRPLLEKKKGPSSRLIEAMKCTNCERFLTPHRAYKCITGHFFCHICKGTNKFGPECQKCFIMYEIHRKIRPCPALVETHSDLKKCLQYIETCPDCKNLYYKFDKDGHISCKRQWCKHQISVVRLTLNIFLQIQVELFANIHLVNRLSESRLWLSLKPELTQLNNTDVTHFKKDWWLRDLLIWSEVVIKYVFF